MSLGTLKKAYFKSNGSEPLVTDGEVQVSDVILTNTVYNESPVTSTAHPSQHIPAWTTDASFPEDHNHRNTSKSEGAECERPLMSVEPRGRFLSVATDALNSQSYWSLRQSSTLLSDRSS